MGKYKNTGSFDLQDCLSHFKRCKISLIKVYSVNHCFTGNFLGDSLNSNNKSCSYCLKVSVHNTAFRCWN